MYRTNKRLLLVLLTIMAYLPMTVMNVANAMPNASVPMSTQSIVAMDMTNMAMIDAGVADCHHQANKSCEHCSIQSGAHCVHNACSVSLAITTPYSLLNINRDLKNNDKTMRISTQFQQPTRLLRPPISI